MCKFKLLFSYLATAEIVQLASWEIVAYTNNSLVFIQLLFAIHHRCDQFHQ